MTFSINRVNNFYRIPRKDHQHKYENDERLDVLEQRYLGSGWKLRLYFEGLFLGCTDEEAPHVLRGTILLGPGGRRRGVRLPPNHKHC